MRLNPDVPSELERIINRALEKDRELRYQHASEMRAELQRLKRDTGSGKKIAAEEPPPETLASGLRAFRFARQWFLPCRLRAGVGNADGGPFDFRSGRVRATRIRCIAVRGGANRCPRTGSRVFQKVSIHWSRAFIGCAIAGGLYWRSHSPQKLTEKDSILLADFVNTTGDPVFDGTLKQALAVQLEQSPYLNITPDQTVRKALQFMGRPADERVTGGVAREICEREHIKAMMSGSIASLGSQYVIALDATNCATGDSLAREQVTAPSKEAVLSAVDKVGVKPARKARRVAGFDPEVRHSRDRGDHLVARSAQSLRGG